MTLPVESVLANIFSYDDDYGIESDALAIANGLAVEVHPLCGDPTCDKNCAFRMSPREARVLAARLLKAAELAEENAMEASS